MTRVPFTNRYFAKHLLSVSRKWKLFTKAQSCVFSGPRILAGGLISLILLAVIYYFEDQSGKEILEIRPKIAELGNLPQDQIESVEFVLENRAKAKLEDVTVISSCGCTVTKMQTKEILPFATAELNVDFHSARKRGAISQPILVQYRVNDVLLTTRCDVRAYVEPTVQFKPEVILITSPEYAEMQLRKTIRLASDNQNLSIIRVFANFSAIRPTVSEQGGRAAQISVSFDMAALRSERMSHTSEPFVSVVLDDTPPRVIDVPIVFEEGIR